MQKGVYSEHKFCSTECHMEATRKRNAAIRHAKGLKKRGRKPGQLGFARRFESWMMEWGKAGASFYTTLESKDCTALAAHRNRSITTRRVLVIDEKAGS